MAKDSTFKRNILPCVKGYGFFTLITPVLIIIEVVLEVLIPTMMANALNNIKSGEPSMEFILRTGGMMVLVSIGSLACGMLASRTAAVASVGFAKNIRRNVFFKIQDFSFLNLDKYSTASLITRCTTDIANIQNTYLQLIRGAVRAPVMFILATIMAFRLNPELALVFAVAIPIIGGTIGITSKLAFPRFQRMMKSFDNLNSGVQENLIGVRVVKSFVRDEYENEKFLEKALEVTKAQISAEKLLIFVMPVMNFVMQMSKLAITGVGGTFLVAGSIEVGDLTAMISYAIQILNSLLMLSMLAISLITSKASIIRINEVLDTKLDIVGGDSEKVVTDGSIEFEHVNFSYNNGDNLILSDISFKINSGETVGIIAGTGEGKTTLVQLIPRLYDVNDGAVKVGGVDVRDYSLTNLRDSVSMVLQKNVLFSGTIRDNLRWGDQSATQEQIEKACKSAQAHKFITSFPNGYDTELGQGGVNVSGGQKQRLCIARALLKKPKILILDDSTSAVDTATDSKIREAFKKELPDTTKLIIAQRVASVIEADKIIVMEQGKIVDIGNHIELLDRCEIYREVYESQAMGVK